MTKQRAIELLQHAAGYCDHAIECEPGTNWITMDTDHYSSARALLFYFAQQLEKEAL